MSTQPGLPEAAGQMNAQYPLKDVIEKNVCAKKIHQKRGTELGRGEGRHGLDCSLSSRW